MTEIFRPDDAAGVLDAVIHAVAEDSPLEVVGGGSKRALGRPVEAGHRLDLSGLAGIELYEPAELVMTALPGTPLVTIEAALAEQGQQLAFEPPDLGPLLGGAAAGGTIGILIPPSVVMVIYGLLTETSISALFLAGFVPGILTVLGFMVTISIACRIDPKLGPPAPRTAMPERIKALGSVWGKPVGKLSRGFRQRVGMAQALLHDPEVLILDEPTSGLDPNQVHDVRELIINLGKTKTILLSTHILQEVRAVCSRVILIDEGRIVLDGSVDDMEGGQHDMEQRFRELTNVG